LEIASRLNVEAVPYEVWQRLNLDREQFERMKLEGDRRQQAQVLAGLVQARLDGPWRPRVCLSSSVGNEAGDAVSTVMVLDTGLGFRSAVWHQIAQLLCRLDEVYICDGCHRPYQRRMLRLRPPPDARQHVGGLAARILAAEIERQVLQQRSVQRVAIPQLAGQQRSLVQPTQPDQAVEANPLRRHDLHPLGPVSDRDLRRD
jgi:predicted Fe-S protein YdhL (DUF1289 family)